MRGDGASSLELRGDLPGGRRELRMRVGTFRVVVAEIPARSLTDHEWSDIERARSAYGAMWGDHDADVFVNDPFDGWKPPYRAWHYRAYVTREGEPGKLVVMRKVMLVPSEMTEAERADPGDLLPVDVRFWRVRTDVGSVPLWEALRNHTRRVAPNDRYPEFRIASLSRAAVSRAGDPPHEIRTPPPRFCGDPGEGRPAPDTTAIGFAAIHLLASQGDPSLLFVHSLCPEFRDRVMGLRGAGGAWVGLDFARTEDTLGLPCGSVNLDNDLAVVQMHKTSFPGYFVHNDDAAQVIADLLDEGRITVDDLRVPAMRLLARESARGTDLRVLEELTALLVEPDHQRLADVLTRPRMFKYLVPLIAGDHALHRMSAGDLRSRLLYETRDGPFSSTVLPATWAASAWALLDAAARKHRPTVAEPRIARPVWRSRRRRDLPRAASGL